MSVFNGFVYGVCFCLVLWTIYGVVECQWECFLADFKYNVKLWVRDELDLQLSLRGFDDD